MSRRLLMNNEGIYSKDADIETEKTESLTNFGRSD